MIRPALPGTDTDRTYDLDGLGNWQESVYTPVSGSETTDQRTHNYLNQVTEFDDGTDVLYDHGDNTGDEAHRGNGNLVDDGTRVFAYDALNRLKEVRKKDGGARVATYTYDALGRRIRKVVENGGIPGDSNLNATTDYLYSGVQCIEERDMAGTPPTDDVVRQYVWGQYVDELIQQREVDGSPADFYLLSDLLYRSVALTDDSSTIQEAYDTDAYGHTLVFSGPGPGGVWFTDNDVPTDAPTCTFVFTGRRFDPETGIYYYRARYYHAALGRFISRDPIGYQGGMALYQYVGSNPASWRDPSGQNGPGVPPDLRFLREKRCYKQPECDQCLAAAQAKYERMLETNRRHYERLQRAIDADMQRRTEICKGLPSPARQLCLLSVGALEAKWDADAVAMYLAADAFAYSV